MTAFPFLCYDVLGTIPLDTEVFDMGHAGMGFGFGKPAFWIGLAIGAAAGFFGYRYMEQKKAEQHMRPVEEEAVALLEEPEKA